ncbi:D-alanyl-D-alanine carboxypeptidase [Alloactinosynnema sp. L-07]|uniref:serine hydrolase domain-containing protein n=1 Tax=Alloactinosynnema sp. L-07 TaxID=1653480 RepID=UPI00065F059B|nr:serine hydrolase domain-containing protein [Alloactinosynnema sp. L-07]CRK56617.1 D-alanyl-D-alanine carboxypeptidase [Alloactinosynnema sp. L-07]
MTDSRPLPTTSPNRAQRRRWPWVAATAVVLAGAATGLVVQPALGGEAAATMSGSAGGRPMQVRLNALVRDEGFPASLAAVRSADGRIRNFTAGVASLTEGGKVPTDGHVRIGSNTKTFVATVVLQLVGEGKVGLDDPIEKYLPGLVRGDGIDGHHITVRQLLQHTSGLPDYDEEIGGNFEALQHNYLDPRGVLDKGLSHPALFAPGTAWSYSNTNYLLAGLLIEKVTGRPVGEEITRRVIDRIGLRDTSWPGVGDQSIPGRHPQGYFAAKEGAPLVNVTTMDPSWGWAAGQLISTPSDVTRFFTALLGGRLLKPEQLAEMKKTVAAPHSSVRGDERYGLGIQTFTLSCGGFAWSHGGDIPGFETRNAATEDGRVVSLTVTSLPTTEKAARHVEDVVDAAMCD